MAPVHKLLLVQANDRYHGMPSLGLAYLGSYIKKYCVNVEVIILEKIPEELNEIIQIKPTVVGIGSLTHNFPDAINFMRKLKNEINFVSVIGGCHITAVPQFLPVCFDIGIIGEGEETLAELLSLESFEKKNLLKVKGIVYHNGDLPVINEKRPLMKSLDKIPPLDRKMLKMDHYLKPQNTFGPHIGRGGHMFTSRGCPYKCPFCFSTAFWQNSLRYHSSIYVVNEIKSLIQDYDLKLIYLYDDLFCINKKRLKEVVTSIRREGFDKIAEYGVLGRCELFDDKIAEMLSSMNVIHVNFGMESGSQKMLDYLKGGVTKKNIRNAVEIAKKHGLTVDGSFIIGNPGETEEDMRETLEFILSLELDKFSFTVATAYPGTKFWDIMMKRRRVNYDIDWRKLQMKDPDILIKENDIMLMIDSIDHQRFYDIWRLFEKERKKIWDYDWRKHN